MLCAKAWSGGLVWRGDHDNADKARAIIVRACPAICCHLLPSHGTAQARGLL